MEDVCAICGEPSIYNGDDFALTQNNEYAHADCILEKVFP